MSYKITENLITSSLTSGGTSTEHVIKASDFQSRWYLCCFELWVPLFIPHSPFPTGVWSV